MHSRYLWTTSVVLAVALCVALSLPSYAVTNPPLCPHVIGWNSDINTWAQGAPWIKVIFATDIAPAKATGAKVMYRPFTADTVYWENGYLPDQRTGATYADLVWAQISGLAQKPEAVTYRNEFDWSNPTKAKRTCAEFPNYKNRLRALGYTGKVIFGSFPPDWVSASTWQDPDLMNAVNASDGVETHEYFDFDVNCCSPSRCFRHRDVAITNNPYLQNKDWYIGEFGSDVDHGACSYCGDGLWRTGWRDRGKLTEQQYIDQMKIYRAGCAIQVVAVFVFQQGDQTSWSNYEVVGTSVATYMRSTWFPASGQVTGTVKGPNGTNITGATVTLSPGGYSAQSTNGAFTIPSVPLGTYTVTATMPGYARQSFTGNAVTSGSNPVVAFSLAPISAINSVKALANGKTVAITGVVTARITVNGTQTAIYVENEDRASAIRVSWSGAANIGDKVEVTGTTFVTSSLERYVSAISVNPVGTGSVRPMLVTSSFIGGNSLPYSAATGTGQSAAKVWHWVKLGEAPPVRMLTDVPSLNNTGLLVKLAGRVTANGTGYFYLDDGSAWDDFETPDAALGMPSGLRIALPDNTTAPSVGSFVVVTGISSYYRSSDSLVYRMLRVWRSGDIVTVLP